MRFITLLTIAIALNDAYASNMTASPSESGTKAPPQTITQQGSSTTSGSGHTVHKDSSSVLVLLTANGNSSRPTHSLETHSQDVKPSSLADTTHSTKSVAISHEGQNSTNLSSKAQPTTSITSTSEASPELATSIRVPESLAESRSSSANDSATALVSTTIPTVSPPMERTVSSRSVMITGTPESSSNSRNSTTTHSPGRGSTISGEVTSFSGDTSSETMNSLADSGESILTQHATMVNSTTSTFMLTTLAAPTTTSGEPLTESSPHADPSGTLESFLPIGSLITGSSTVTSVPSSVTFESIPAFTGNTWTTTTKDHSSTTVVPIIGGVMIWHLPTQGPGTVFNLPDLPKFQLPSCIIGACPDPPKIGEDEGKGKGNGGDEPDRDDQDDDDEEQDDDEDEDETSTSSSETPTSETSSSTSSCSGGETTVSDCRVACSTSYSRIDETITATQKCYTTSCQQTIGCSIEPTTTTSTETSISACTAQEQWHYYDPSATLSSLGLDIPLWMQFALTYDSMIAETTSDLTATSESATDAQATITSEGTQNPATMSTAPAESTTDDSASIKTTSTTFPAATPDASDTEDTSEPTTSMTSASLSSRLITSSETRSATMTISETTEPTPVCHNESDLPGHPPVDAAMVDRGAELFCGVHRQWYPGYEGVTNMTSDSAEENVTYQEVNSQVNYSYEVVWKDGDACQYMTEVQQIDKPIGGDTWDCRTLLNTAYSGCNNGGVGGFLDAGCLRYTFTGGQDNDDVDFSPMPANIRVKIPDLL